MKPNFDDIRPYQDEEVPCALANLLVDNEFLNTIVNIRFPRVPNWLLVVLRPLLRVIFLRAFKKVHTVEDVQVIVKRYLTRCVLETAKTLDVKTSEALHPSDAFTFVSNHRDITMDPALCNLVCHNMGRKTSRIAIGDNLLSKPFVSDVMRLNKSFIVKRSIDNMREKFRELKRLSAYMRQSISEENESVWIAQREGRAKDGIDETEEAVIKMLMLSADKSQSFAENVAQLRIVPVSISYQWDPLDSAKALELAKIEKTGSYVKQQNEDISSIAVGIQGWKGRISIFFGGELKGDFQTSDEIVEALDKQVILGYKLQASHWVAYEMQQGKYPDFSGYKAVLSGFEDSVNTWSKLALESAEKQLRERVNKLAHEPVAQKHLLQSYANPVLQKLLKLEQLVKAK